MTNKEKIQAEIAHLTEADMDELLRVIQEMQAKEPLSLAKKPGFLAKLREIKIDGPEDFAANLDEYMYGGKKVGGETDIR